MHVLLAILATAFFVAQYASADQVEFTAPPTTDPLNISSPSILIAWTIPPGSQEASYEQVDLWWTGNADGFGYELAENLTVANTTRYAWDPRAERDALRRTNHSVSAGKDFGFELRFHGIGTARGATISKGGFGVVGYRDGEGSGGGRREVLWGVVGWVVGLALVWGL
ncbi:hypothetical protein QBC47DRAFT_444834 [Echria macrotheca]|uniref:Uncharacterized protein n=1 Tax=Echria macrotheca TaxID=438768 RepID=A0AAJ0F627_9PEZI|nr:hypothetical protein QBC47DRAFT_444834 [Echria macrotheca]